MKNIWILIGFMFVFVPSFFAKGENISKDNDNLKTMLKHLLLI